MNTSTDQQLMMLASIADMMSEMDTNASAMHDLIEDGLFGDVPVSEPSSEPILVHLSTPSTRLRPSALAA